MHTKTPITGVVTALALCFAAPAAAQEAAAAPQVDLKQIAPAALRQDLLKGIYGAIAIPGRNQLWVASSPSFDKGTPGFVDLLDATDLRPLRRIELARRAFALALDQARGRVYVGNTLDGSLTVLDAASGLVVDTIQLGKPDGEGSEHTRMVRVDPESGRVFVTSPSETGTLWIVDPAEDNAVQRLDNAGLWSAGLAVDAKHGRAYAKLLRRRNASVSAAQEPVWRHARTAASAISAQDEDRLRGLHRSGLILHPNWFRA
jgi:hypothetical protein